VCDRLHSVWNHSHKDRGASLIIRPGCLEKVVEQKKSRSSERKGVMDECTETDEKEDKREQA